MRRVLLTPGFAGLLWTQFLGTLNDNLLKMVVILLAAGLAVGSRPRRLTPKTHARAQTFLRRLYAL